MLPIVGLSKNESTRMWSVRVRFEDGTFGSVQLGENSFIDAATHTMGQVMLMCWLTQATPEP